MKSLYYLTGNFILLITILGISWASENIDRQLETVINPNCAELCNNTNSNLVYTKSTGPNDVLHYIWSTIGVPTFIIAQTNKMAELKIDWTNLLDEKASQGSIQFTEQPNYAYGVILANLIEFDDSNDTNSLGSGIVVMTDMGTLDWDLIDVVDINSTTHCQVTFQTKLNNESSLFEEDGQLLIQVSTHGDEDHNEILPRLPFNSNSSEIRLTLNKLKPQLNNSRYGFEVIVLSMEVSDQNWTVSEMDTINDEYTPGVFKTVHITSPEVEKNFGSYLMWKPVSYTSGDLTVIESSDVNLHGVEGSVSTLRYSIAEAFFVNQTENLMNQFNVTFGTVKDGFYKKTGYSVWAFSSGIGMPLNEKFSLLVIMVLASGLGLPLVIMISSTIYIFVHKYRKTVKTPSVNSPLNFN